MRATSRNSHAASSRVVLVIATARAVIGRGQPTIAFLFFKWLACSLHAFGSGSSFRLLFFGDRLTRPDIRVERSHRSPIRCKGMKQMQHRAASASVLQRSGAFSIRVCSSEIQFSGVLNEESGCFA